MAPSVHQAEAELRQPVAAIGRAPEPLRGFAVVLLDALPQPIHDRENYGSVSVVTFAAALTYLSTRGIGSEPTMPLFVALLEVPGLLVGVLLARLGTGRGAGVGPILREAFVGKSVVLLVGGLVAGAVLGSDGLAPVKPFFGDLFKGALCLFMLELGLDRKSTRLNSSH